MECVGRQNVRTWGGLGKGKGLNRPVLPLLFTYHRYVFPSVLINSLIYPLYGRFATAVGRERVGKPTDAKNEFLWHTDGGFVG